MHNYFVCTLTLMLANTFYASTKKNDSHDNICWHYKSLHWWYLYLVIHFMKSDVLFYILIIVAATVWGGPKKDKITISDGWK